MIAERRKIIEGNSLNKSENLFEAFFDEINQTAQIDQNLKEEEKKIFLNYAKGIL
jgi:t-SNARE complex subunit (syntaxin)